MGWVGVEGVPISLPPYIPLNIVPIFPLYNPPIVPTDKRISEWSGEECWESVKRVLQANHALGGITNFSSSDHLPW